MPTKDNTKAAKIAKYIDEAYTAAMNYKTRVENGQQIACDWIKKAVQRSRKDEKRKDIYFRVEAARRALEFFYFCFIPGDYGYKRFKLSPYQAWIVTELFGWFYTHRPDKRRYRYAYLFTARKTGKTVFAVCIEKVILMYDYKERPEAYLCATTREQAGQALEYSKAIVLNSPSLRRRLRVQQHRILYDKRRGLLKVLANRPNNNDSLNPAVVVMDEMHAHETLDFFNVMKSGILNRPNPLVLLTSTAGFNKDYPFYTMIETGKKVLEGIIEDDITFYALYMLDEGDEIEDFETWEKANPNIGVTVDLEDLKNEYFKAKLMPTELNNFITKNLNRYLDNLEQWIPDNIYRKSFNPVELPTIKVAAYGGIDIAATRDMACFLLCWTDPETGRMQVLPEFYFPEKESKKIRESGIDLGVWIDKGFIIEHPGPKIDHDLILERVAYYKTIFDIKQINYDDWNQGMLISKIESKLFINCKNFPQNPKYFNFPLKFIEGLFFTEEIDTGKNPVLRWHFRNVVLYYDGNGNIKIMKNKSLDSVEGPVCLGMAAAAWLEFNNDAMAKLFQELYDT